MPQQEHRIIVEATETLTREQIVAQLSPINEKEIDFNDIYTTPTRLFSLDENTTG